MFMLTYSLLQKEPPLSKCNVQQVFKFFFVKCNFITQSYSHYNTYNMFSEFFCLFQPVKG